MIDIISNVLVGLFFISLSISYCLRIYISNLKDKIADYSLCAVGVLNGIIIIIKGLL